MPDDLRRPSHPVGDSVCPRCDHLLWLLRDQRGGIPLEQINLDALLREDLGLDWLDLVEAAMELE